MFKQKQLNGPYLFYMNEKAKLVMYEMRDIFKKLFIWYLKAEGGHRRPDDHIFEYQECRKGLNTCLPLNPCLVECYYPGLLAELRRNFPVCCTTKNFWEQIVIERFPSEWRSGEYILPHLGHLHPSWTGFKTYILQWVPEERCQLWKLVNPEKGLTL